ncbi:MAG TPA: hypothetical protein VK540_25635 [Polyangiaceae bacterium]|nr:hypothetical protein [Polyangiaceae bacterium]
MRTLPSPSQGFLTEDDAKGLKVSSRWARDPVTLVPAERAVGVEPGDALSIAEARWWLETCVAENPRAVRDFVGSAQLGAPSPHLLSDGELRQWIIDRIETGRLVAVHTQGLEGDGASGPWRALRDLVRRIAALAPGALFRAGGRQYKVFVGIDLLKLADRDQYELATQKEAQRILGEISQASEASPVLLAILAEAREKLSHDWRPPLEPDGLVLLRRKVTNRVIRPNDIPVLTPSEMVPREEKSWIEIELLDEEGEPYAGDVELTLADGRKVRASSNAKGLVRLDGITAGSCQVSIPDLDASSWAPK